MCDVCESNTDFCFYLNRAGEQEDYYNNLFSKINGYDQFVSVA